MLKQQGWLIFLHRFSHKPLKTHTGEKISSNHCKGLFTLKLVAPSDVTWHKFHASHWLREKIFSFLFSDSQWVAWNLFHMPSDSAMKTAPNSLCVLYKEKPCGSPMIFHHLSLFYKVFGILATILLVAKQHLHCTLFYSLYVQLKSCYAYVSTLPSKLYLITSGNLVSFER